MDDGYVSARTLRKRKLQQHSTVDEQIENLIDRVKTCRRFMIFSGSGLSASSGMSMFSTRNGLYDRACKRFNVADGIRLFSYPFFKPRRQEVTAFFMDIYKESLKARPGAAHLAIKHLKDMDLLHRHYTMNVDGVAEKLGFTPWHHEDSPNGDLVELHGNIKYLVCCDQSEDVDCKWQEEVSSETVYLINRSKKLTCRKCQSPMRFKIMLYEDEQSELIMPDKVMDQLDDDLADVDCVIWVGISFEQSASKVYFKKVRTFLDEKGRLGDVTQAIVNVSETAYTNVVNSGTAMDKVNIVNVVADADEVLSRLVEKLGGPPCTVPSAYMRYNDVAVPTTRSAPLLLLRQDSPDSDSDMVAAPDTARPMVMLRGHRFSSSSGLPLMATEESEEDRRKAVLFEAACKQLDRGWGCRRQRPLRKTRASRKAQLFQIVSWDDVPPYDPQSGAAELAYSNAPSLLVTHAALPHLMTAAQHGDPYSSSLQDWRSASTSAAPTIGSHIASVHGGLTASRASFERDRHKPWPLDTRNSSSTGAAAAERGIKRVRSNKHQSQSTEEDSDYVVNEQDDDDNSDLDEPEPTTPRRQYAVRGQADAQRGPAAKLQRIAGPDLFDARMDTRSASPRGRPRGFPSSAMLPLTGASEGEAPSRGGAMDALSSPFTAGLLPAATLAAIGIRDNFPPNPHVDFPLAAINMLGNAGPEAMQLLMAQHANTPSSAAPPPSAPLMPPRAPFADDAQTDTFSKAGVSNLTIRRQQLHGANSPRQQQQQRPVSPLAAKASSVAMTSAALSEPTPAARTTSSDGNAGDSLHDNDRD